MNCVCFSLDSLAKPTLIALYIKADLILLFDKKLELVPLTDNIIFNTLNISVTSYELNLKMLRGVVGPHFSSFFILGKVNVSKQSEILPVPQSCVKFSFSAWVKTLCICVLIFSVQRCITKKALFVETWNIFQ
jgi:hypothetical protein